jgi:hypothetical protein
MSGRRTPTERQRLLALPPNLADEVRSGRLTLVGAEAEAYERARPERERRRLAVRQAEWQQRQAEEHRLAMPRALFVQAHCPGLGRVVISGALSLRDAVDQVREMTGCDLGCGHEPLTAEQVGQLREACRAAGLSGEQADDLIAWNPQGFGGAS